MTTISRLAVDGRCKTTRAAAAWITGFHPHVQVQGSEASLELLSAVHGEEELRAIWSTTFANEVAFERAREGRAAAMAALSR